MENIIKFVGDNQKLFSRVTIESLNAKLTLLVPETHNAILIKDGQMLQTLSSGKYLVCNFVDLKTETDCALEVLFMSKTAKLKMLWGTPQKILMFDEKSGQNYHAGFSGDFEVQVGDPRKCYLYLVGAAEALTADALQERLQSNVVAVMETVLVAYVQENKVPFNQIALHKKQVSQKILNALSRKLQSEYGIAVFSFNIANIIIDSEEIKKLEARNQSTTVCKGCGAALNETDKFCSKCGKKVEEETVCANCQTQNAPGAQFCTNCGQRL